VNEMEQLRRLRAGLPGPRREGRESARAALMERASLSGTPRRRRRRRHGRRALALVGAACLTAAIVIATGSSGGPSARPEVASASELRHLATVFPRLQIAGPWQILTTEGSGAEGSVELRYEGEPALLPRFDNPPTVEIRWRSSSREQRVSELLAEGFLPAGQMTVEQQRPISGSALPFTYRPVQVSAYVSRGPGADRLSTVALWNEGGRVFELAARLRSLNVIWRLAERVELLRENEWLVALRPGGGRFLAEATGGAVKVEKVKIGERPNGEPIYATRGLIEGPGPGERLEEPDLSKPSPPTIYREGDEVRIVVTPPPG
jgi:hypothetical protein